MEEKNIPRPFDIEHVGQILEEEELDFRFEEAELPTGTTRLIRTGFANAAIAFTVDDGDLICEALWRGEIPREEATRTLAVCNEYNQLQFAPTLRFYESGEHHIAVNAFRTLDISQGASFNQVGAYVMSTLDAIVGAFNFLEQQFPNLVTWEENHEH